MSDLKKKLAELKAAEEQAQRNLADLNVRTLEITKALTNSKAELARLVDSESAKIELSIEKCDVIEREDSPHDYPDCNCPSITVKETYITYNAKHPDFDRVVTVRFNASANKDDIKRYAMWDILTFKVDSI